MQVVLVAVGVVLAGVAGIGLAPALVRRPGLHAAGLAFAAGTLLTLILLHVLPQAVAFSPRAPLLFVFGFVAMMVVQQQVLGSDPCCGHDHTSHSALPSALALGLCSLNDGVVLSSDMERGLASPLFWALSLHKALAAFALVMLLREVGAVARPRWTRAYLGGFLLMTPLALLCSAQLEATGPWRGYLLGCASGALLYVVAGGLVPRVEHLARERGKLVFATFLLAVAVNVAMELAGDHGGPPLAPPGAGSRR